MTEDFSRYISSLPKQLSDAELEILFYELKKYKDEYNITGDIAIHQKYLDIREKIISHNLRMCYNFAVDFCKKRNMMKDIEDVYSICVYNFITSMDNFDITQPYKITSYFYKAFTLELHGHYGKSLEDALSYKHIAFNDDVDKDGEDRDCFEFIADDSESNIQDDFASSEFVDDVIHFIEKIEDDKHKQMVMMHLGIGYVKKYSNKEIGDIIGESSQSVSRKIFDEMNKIRTYIIDKYRVMFPDEYEKIKNKPVFSSKEEMDEYIVACYFADDEKSRTARELVEELGVTETYVYNLVSKFRTDKKLIRKHLDERKYCLLKNKLKCYLKKDLV